MTYTKIRCVIESAKTRVRREIQSAKDEHTRTRAYHKWQTATGGRPVSEEESRRFWLEADREVSPWFNLMFRVLEKF